MRADMLRHTIHLDAAGARVAEHDRTEGTTFLVLDAPPARVCLSGTHSELVALLRHALEVLER